VLLKEEVFNQREMILGWSPSVEQALVSIVDEKDQYTHEHSQRVTELSLVIGGILKQAPKQLSSLKKSARLHDLGKLCIPDHILNKNGKLTDEEYEKVKTHCDKAVFILASVLPKDIVDAIHAHHEWWDGSGYPRGLKGEEIPLNARIIAIADTIDAMSLDRPYRPGKERGVIISELRKGAGTQFDPRIVQAVVEAQIDLR
jgi:energy-coupling factor transport system substrate-specific component